MLFLVFCWRKNSFRSFQESGAPSSGLGLDQDRHPVGPNLGPNFLQSFIIRRQKSPPARKEFTHSPHSPLPHKILCHFGKQCRPTDHLASDWAIWSGSTVFYIPTRLNTFLHLWHANCPLIPRKCWHFHLFWNNEDSNSFSWGQEVMFQFKRTTDCFKSSDLTLGIQLSKGF